MIFWPILLAFYIGVLVGLLVAGLCRTGKSGP